MPGAVPQIHDQGAALRFVGGTARCGADSVCALSADCRRAACRPAVQRSLPFDDHFAGGAGHDGERDGQPAGTFVRGTRIGIQRQHARGHEVGADGSGGQRTHARTRAVAAGDRTARKHAGHDGLPRRRLLCAQGQHRVATGRQIAGHLQPRRGVGRVLQGYGYLRGAEAVKGGHR